MNRPQSQQRQHARRKLRLVLEPLEARRLLAGLNVSVILDQDGSRDIGPADTRAVGRVVFLDLNRSGGYDERDPVAFTDTRGEARFEGIAPGEYSVGLAPGSRSQQQSFPTDIADLSTTLYGKAAAVVASNDLAYVWAFDAQGSGEMIVGGDSLRADLGGPILDAATVSEKVWLLVKPRLPYATELVEFDLRTGQSTTRQVEGLGSSKIVGLVATGQRLYAQVDGAWTTGLGELSVGADAIRLATTASFPIDTVFASASGSENLLAIEPVMMLTPTGFGESAEYRLAEEQRVTVLAPQSLQRGVSRLMPASAAQFTLSQDGLHLLAALDSGGVKVFDAQDLREVAYLHEANAPLVADSGDGRIVTGSETTGELIVWDSDRWQPVGRTRLPSGAPQAARLSANGDTLVTLGSDGVYRTALAIPALIDVQVVDDIAASATLGVRVDKANRGPLASTRGIELMEDVLGRGQLRSLVGDQDGDQLWFTLVAPPEHGRLEITTLGQWSYLPNRDKNGSDLAIVRVFDGQTMVDVPIHLHVAPVNDPPRKLTLELNSIQESATDDVELGQLYVEDVDGDLNFRFVSGDPRFEVRGDRLYLVPGSSIDFENEPDIELLVTAIEDQTIEGYRITTMASLSVTDVNEPPTELKLTRRELPENTPGAVVGDLTIVDPDMVNNFTFVVSDDRFVVENGQLKLRPGVQIDFESEGEIPLAIQVDDGSGQLFEQSIMIAVEDNNDVPTGIEVTVARVNERSPGAVVGAVRVIDQDEQAYHFTLSDDRFEVVDGLLKLRDGVSLTLAEASEVLLTITATSGTSDRASSTVAVPVASAGKLFMTNPVEPRDVNNDGSVTPLDAMLVIQYLNSRRAGSPPPVTQGSGEFPYYLDVNGDDKVTPVDVLLIINYLNRLRAMRAGASSGGAEGESSGLLADSFTRTPPAVVVSKPAQLVVQSAEDDARVCSAEDYESLTGTSDRLDREALDVELESLLDELSRERLKRRRG